MRHNSTTVASISTLQATVGQNGNRFPIIFTAAACPCSWHGEEKKLYITPIFVKMLGQSSQPPPHRIGLLSITGARHERHERFGCQSIERAQLQEMADGMLAIYRTLARMRYLEPEWIEEGPHDLSEQLGTYRAAGLDDDRSTSTASSRTSTRRPHPAWIFTRAASFWIFET